MIVLTFISILSNPRTFRYPLFSCSSMLITAHSTTPFPFKTTIFDTSRQKVRITPKEPERWVLIFFLHLFLRGHHRSCNTDLTETQGHTPRRLSLPEFSLSGLSEQFYYQSYDKACSLFLHGYFFLCKFLHLYILLQHQIKKSNSSTAKAMSIWNGSRCGICNPCSSAITRKQMAILLYFIDFRLN